MSPWSLPRPSWSWLSDKSGRTGIKVDYTDPLRGKTQLIIRAASWKSTKATIADGQGIIGEIRWGRSRKKEGPKKRRDGDCWGTDVSTRVTRAKLGKADYASMMSLSRRASTLR